MTQIFKGFHGEWNLGSPGGWEYQKLVQEIYKPAWQKIKDYTNIDLELDLDDELFQPSKKLTEVLLDSHKLNFPTQDPFIVLMAEEETLKDVQENISFVENLKTVYGIEAKLIGPQELKYQDDKIMVGDKEVTALFMDFNTTALLKLKGKHSIEPILKAIEKNILVNPRGMETINAKGIFEAVNLDFKDQLSESTVKRTPWTRKFYERKTSGPEGEDISDLVQWARDNWPQVVLKPEQGWSGKGIIIGIKDPDTEGGIKAALKAGNYIIQKLIPTEIWSEMMPEIDKANKKVVLKENQTDFRCFITHRGLAGFLARNGGIPTNVGSGGGVQTLAIIKSRHTPKEATELLNTTIAELTFDQATEIRKIIDDGAIAREFVYINGPIPINLRPRLISEEQVKALESYALNLYQDTLFLEKEWSKGNLNHILSLTEEEKTIANLQLRTPDTPAMMASDGLFGFSI